LLSIASRTRNESIGHLRLQQIRAELPRRVRVGDQVERSERDLPGGRLKQSDDLTDEGRIARAVGSQQSKHLAGPQLETDLVVGAHPPWSKLGLTGCVKTPCRTHVESTSNATT
jgi:hypothetical protein